MTKQKEIKKRPYIAAGGPYHDKNIWLSDEDGRPATAVFTDHDKAMTGRYVKRDITDTVHWEESNV